jgi:hypothetical protein
MLLQPTAVKALPDYRIWLRYSDGTEGEVDLSYLAGRGVFAIWKQPGAFEAVTIGPGRAIRWGDEVELCPDSLYMRLTGKTPDMVFPALRASEVRA